MASREYFVIDGREKGEAAQAFGTLVAAKHRAREMAKADPGQTVVIAQSVAFVTCDVSPPTVSMRERKL